MNNLTNVILAVADWTRTIGVALLVILILVVVVVFFVFFAFFKLWLRARLSRADVKFSELIGMWLRGVPRPLIVLSKIKAVQAGLTLTTRDLESHYLSGGNVPNVVLAAIKANRANIDLTLKGAMAIDLAGRDIADGVGTSVEPRIIDCPSQESGAAMLDAVARDGIRLLVKARVTVRCNIPRLVGGATQHTIIARVGEGIVSAIGSSETYSDVLENPDNISKTVLEKGLDAGTAFEIVSIDIADVSVAAVGQVANVGAELDKLRAQADKEMRQAEAEGRAAMARALEQEMKAEVVRNEAKVPLAIAEAFQKGNLGIMDYYRLKNISADTSMRDSIAKPKKKE